MTELNRDFMLENGAGFSSAPSPGGFTAGQGWEEEAAYDLTAYSGKTAKGVIPMPNQHKIDRFQKEMARHFIELDVAEKKEASARGALDEEEDNRSVEERMAEVEEAQKRVHEIYDKFADTTAVLCTNKPTAKQIKDLPHHELIRFINHVSGLIDPNG